MRWNPSKKESPADRIKRLLAFYYPILQPLEFQIPKKQLEAWILETMQTFKRRDRIQYMLMLHRMLATLRLLEKLPRDSTNPTVKKLQKVYFKYFDAYGNPDPQHGVKAAPVFPNRLPPDQEEELQSSLQGGVQELEHLANTALRQNLPSAVALVWEHQPMYALCVEMQSAIEDDRSDISQEFILEDDEYSCGELIVECGNRLGWYLLRDPKQWKDEATLMDHCATSKDGWLLSLRERVEDRGLRPHLTFEYIPGKSDMTFKDSSGVLGEMKGRGNSKPSAAYHDCIMRLLLLKNVMWVQGGQYKPENDFKIADLSINNKAILETKKPEFFDDHVLVRERTNDLMTWVNAYFPKHYGTITAKGGELWSKTFSCPTEALNYVAEEGLLNECYTSRDKMTDRLKSLLKICDDPFGLDYYRRLDQRERRDFLSDVQDDKKAWHRFRKTIRKALRNYQIPMSVKTITDLLIDGDFDEVPEEITEPLGRAIDNAVSNGYESGTASEMYRYLVRILPVHTEQGVVVEEDGVKISLKSLFAWILTGENELTISEETCREIRHDLDRAGEAQDYDKSTAIETFVDRIADELLSG